MERLRRLALLAAVAATATAAPTDLDLGLHSDGGIWTFYPAREPDGSRPHVLLIGDSIMNGYRQQVIEALHGEANVDCWLTPMHLNSDPLHADLRKVASHRDYAVIHFNIGLHGWQEGRIPKGKYRELLEAYVAILKEQAPDATLLWASTTQVHAKGTQDLHETINPIIARRNEIAAVVMKEAGIPIVDLYGLMDDQLDLVRGDQWHWQEGAYGIMARQIVESIRATSARGEPDVRIYPAPDGIELSDTFGVAIEGETIPVYKTKVPPVAPIPRLSGSRSEFGFASLASFDMRTRVDVTITCPESVASIKILPTSYGIVPKVHENTITITLDAPKHVTVEVNGDWQESLHIFANPFEEHVPKPEDPNVVFFGPGIHDVTSLRVADNTTVYLAGGAYVRGGMAPDEEPGRVGLSTMLLPTFLLSGTNITIRGRGIIDQQAVPRARRRYSIYVGDSRDVTIEGVTLLDPSRWTVPIKRSDQVHVDNIKIIGWRGNSDGVDISSSRDVLVENCFMRTLDDLVVVKSRTDQGESRDIHVRKCVLWNELAHALSIGAEVRENVSNVLFEDCDVIHDVGRETALRVYHCDDAVISNVTFQNIRVEEARRLISCWIGTTRWTKTPERGHIRNVVFRDITAVSAPIDPTLTGFQDGSDWKPYILKDHAGIELVGYDSDHLVENVLFDNVVLDGRKVTEKHVTKNGFVKNVRFR